MQIKNHISTIKDLLSKIELTPYNKITSDEIRDLERIATNIDFMCQDYWRTKGRKK